MLQARIYIDLVGLTEEEALRQELLDGVKQGRAKPATRPPIPRSDTQKPALPVVSRGTIHNLPFAPNPLFTGRVTELEALNRGLQQDGTMAVTQTLVLHGLGGVGKTQLAVHYAWKYLHQFEVVLWARGDSPETLDASLAGLASVLRLPEAKEHEQAVQIKAVLAWLGEHERWLVIVDNSDTDFAARAVQDRFRPSLRGQLLVTSRLSRWPVTMPDLPLDLFVPEDATRFLMNRVGKAEQYAGDEDAARLLALELGLLPLALEQAAAFIIEMHWSFNEYYKRFRDASYELLGYQTEGGTRYPASVAKTWSITLDQISPLARTLLRIAAWLAPDNIPLGIFSADKSVFPEAAHERVELSALAVEKGLGELARFSLIRLTSETLSIHRLLQAVEQDSLGEDERKEWLMRACQLFDTFAPERPDDVLARDVWLPLSAHAEILIQHAGLQRVNTLPVANVAQKFALFMIGQAEYSKAELLCQLALTISEAALGPEDPDVGAGLTNLAWTYEKQGEYALSQSDTSSRLLLVFRTVNDKGGYHSLSQVVDPPP